MHVAVAADELLAGIEVKRVPVFLLVKGQTGEKAGKKASNNVHL